MTEAIKRFEAHTSEEDCLDEVMRLRHGDAPCRACDERAGFTRLARNRAFACKSCGFQVYPCQGTPFGRSERPLRDWFMAVGEAARGGKVSGRALRKLLGLPGPEADRLAADVEAMRKTAEARGPRADLFGPIAGFVQARSEAARADAKAKGAASPSAERSETVWQTFRAAFALPDLEKRPLLGIGVILGLAVGGAGVGWLLVPSPPVMDEEIEQATAVLTLGNDKPVIVVSDELAAKLYDVTDVDAAPDTRLAASFQVGGAPGSGATGKKLAETQGTVRLALGLGQELLKGDLAAARLKMGARPELAAYNSLANVLESRGPRNPDEILTFGPIKLRRYLVEKIVEAARVTAMDPVLLMAIADKESSFKTEIQAQTSSATGLYQFITSTWLAVVREFGPRYGLAKEAGLIAAGDVPAEERTRILNLRSDAYLSAVMAGEMLKRDSGRIATRLGRQLTGGEIYLVHFLGPGGAEKLLDQASTKPDTVAGQILPQAAAANKAIFYGANADGETKGLSVSQVREKIETMISLRLDRYKGLATKPAAKPAGPPPPLPPSRSGK